MISGNTFVGFCVIIVVFGAVYIIGVGVYHYPLVAAAFAALAFLTFLIQRVLS